MRHLIYVVCFCNPSQAGNHLFKSTDMCIVASDSLPFQVTLYLSVMGSCTRCSAHLFSFIGPPRYLARLPCRRTVRCASCSRLKWLDGFLECTAACGRCFFSLRKGGIALLGWEEWWKGDGENIWWKSTIVVLHRGSPGMLLPGSWSLRSRRRWWRTSWCVDRCPWTASSCCRGPTPTSPSLASSWPPRWRRLTGWWRSTIPGTWWTFWMGTV